MALIYEWLLSSLFWLGVLLFIISIVWLIHPVGLQRMSDYMNRWIATNAFFARLDDQVRLERYFYRHHRVMGILIILGAVFCLYELQQRSGGLLNVWNHLQLVGDLSMKSIITDSMLLILMIGNLLALVTGFVVAIRPSLLKRLEGWGNRWVESNRVTAMLDRNVDIANKWLPSHPRLLGLLTLIGSLYIMSNTAVIALN